jgi:GntR family transcriptional repressor for pyruvate dehydrogenase complex
VGNIIAAIMIAHIGNSAPKVVIGIMFMPTERPNTSTPDIRAIMNMTAHAARIVTKKLTHRMARSGNCTGECVDMIASQRVIPKYEVAKTYVRRLIVRQMKIDPDSTKDFSAQIAGAIREAIISGALPVDERLPSEAELAEQFDVSRSTVREALKRLAAQSLIRTQRGATGGAFVNRLRFEDAYGQQITTSTLLLSMNSVSFRTACEARYVLERACAPLAAERRTADHLATMRAEAHRQAQPGLSDEAFCASDVMFHRALVDAADNPVLSYQLAGAVEGMQPLMNMITFSARDRARIVDLHSKIADAVEAQDATSTDTLLAELSGYTQSLAEAVFAARTAAKNS